MADDELEAIRGRRLAELQAQYGGKVKRETFVHNTNLNVYNLILLS